MIFLQKNTKIFSFRLQTCKVCDIMIKMANYALTLTEKRGDEMNADSCSSRMCYCGQNLKSRKRTFVCARFVLGDI